MTRLLAALMLVGAPALADPVIQLAPEPSPEPVAPTPLVPPPRQADPTVNQERSYSMDLGTGRRIPIGAYGEAHLTFRGDNTEATLRRVVLFFGHQFADWVAVYAELEVENVAGAEIEQTYFEFKPWKKLRLGARAGLILIPLGIINLYHEPPTFNGVDRPLVDQLIIPTTWRELGASIFGTIVDGLHFEVAVICGANGSNFSATNGIGPGLSRGFVINTENVAAAARVHYNRILGFDVGVGGYIGSANNKQDQLSNILVGIVEADARFSRWGLSLRAEYARLFIDGADRITRFLRLTVPTAAAPGESAQGFYGEAGYNVLYPVKRTRHELIAFGRYEYINMHANNADIVNPGGPPPSHSLTLGLTYRPLMELAFKFDYRRTLDGEPGLAPDRFSLGAAFMY